jgi:hypothetical protein
VNAGLANVIVHISIVESTSTRGYHREKTNKIMDSASLSFDETGILQDFDFVLYASQRQTRFRLRTDNLVVSCYCPGLLERRPSNGERVRVIGTWVGEPCSGTVHVDAVEPS